MKVNFTNNSGVVNIKLPKKIKAGDLVSFEPGFDASGKLIEVSIVKKREKKLNPDMPRSFNGVIDCNKENKESMRRLKALIKNSKPLL